MGQASFYSPEDIARYTAEFNVANRRRHLRFAVGAIALIVTFVGGTLFALSL